MEIEKEKDKGNCSGGGDEEELVKAFGFGEVVKG